MSRRVKPSRVRAFIVQNTDIADIIAWAVITIASAVCLLDLWLGTNLIPLRLAAKPDVAATLLILSPAVTFVFIWRGRQIPLGNERVAPWIRAALLLALFLIPNFWRGSW